VTYDSLPTTVPCRDVERRRQSARIFLPSADPESLASPWTPCTFAVGHADSPGPGTTLVVTTDQPHLSNWRGYEGKPILPSAVARAIEQALREGWTPTSRGATFPLDLSAGFVASP